jgi:hypothetical protein
MGLPAEQAAMAEHEAESAAKPWVLVRKHQFQPGVGHVPGRMLYNTVAGAIRAGSTVTVEGLLKQGYRVEVVE